MMPITALSDALESTWDLETGQPSAILFGNAIQVWSVAQDRPTTVQEAALAFNVTPELIRQAVASHYWMELRGDIIEHDGE